MNDTIPTIPFYFIRHGQTDWNREGRLMGQNDIPLNKTGIKQAQVAASGLNDLQIDRIVSSPLLRAKQTAEIISNTISAPISFHDDLKEVYFGTAEGKLKAYEDLHTSWTNGITPDGAESWLAFKQRIVHSTIQSLHNNCITLIVAHGGVFSAIMNFLGYPNQDADNCIPYLFTPPEAQSNVWVVSNVIKNK